MAVAMDAIAICIRVPQSSESTFRVKIMIGNVNVATLNDSILCKGMEYFIVSGDGKTCQWVDGVFSQWADIMRHGLKRTIRVVRQFVALVPNTGWVRTLDNADTAAETSNIHQTLRSRTT